MYRLEIKPLSVNKAWQGRRFKTKEYDIFEKETLSLLRNYKGERVESYYSIKIIFYLKEFGKTDISNLVKCFEDCLVKAQIVKDDRFCLKLEIEKNRSIKDYIEFDIIPEREYNLSKK